LPVLPVLTNIAYRPTTWCLRYSGLNRRVTAAAGGKDIHATTINDQRPP